MTPTIEEVKRVAEELNFTVWSSTTLICTNEELQAFAQHWIEVGRKEQREIDRIPSCDGSIRNNTGE